MMNAAILSLALSALLAPPVETAAQPSTRVYVHTDPAGANVKLDGKPAGKSDDLFVVPPGVSKMIIEVELDGHYPQRQEVEVRGGQITRVELKMTRLPGGEAEKAAPAAAGDAATAAKEAVKAISTMAESDPKLSKILESLKGLDQAAVVAEVAKFLDCKENTLRRAAIFIFWRGEFKSIEPAVPQLLRLCEHKEEFTRGMAALALGANHVEKSLPVLMKMTTEDASGYVRRCAAYALGLLGNKEATATLKKALEDSDPLVHDNAEAALRMIERVQKPVGIDRVVVKGQKAVIEGRADTDSRIVFRDGEGATADWSCGFLKATHFTASLEVVSSIFSRRPELHCRMTDSEGKSLLNYDITEIGHVKVAEGRVVFHEGTVTPRSDGAFVLAEFQPETGDPIPITVCLEKKGESTAFNTEVTRSELHSDPVIARTVNKLVSDFPEQPDLSTPETACAAWQRANARKDAQAISRLSWVALDPVQQEKWYRKEESRDPEGMAIYLKALADSTILEVQTYRGDLADVITYLPFPPGKGRHPFSRRTFGLIDGQWKNLGEDRLPSLEAARATFEEKKDRLWQHFIEMKKNREATGQQGKTETKGSPAAAAQKIASFDTAAKPITKDGITIE